MEPVSFTLHLMFQLTLFKIIFVYTSRGRVLVLLVVIAMINILCLQLFFAAVIYSFSFLSAEPHGGNSLSHDFQRGHM